MCQQFLACPRTNSTHTRSPLPSLIPRIDAPKSKPAFTTPLRAVLLPGRSPFLSADAGELPGPFLATLLSPPSSRLFPCTPRRRS